MILNEEERTRKCITAFFDIIFLCSEINKKKKKKKKTLARGFKKKRKMKR
jgi:hypothetical protein